MERKANCLSEGQMATYLCDFKKEKKLSDLGKSPNKEVINFSEIHLICLCVGSVLQSSFHLQDFFYTNIIIQYLSVF